MAKRAEKARVRNKLFLACLCLTSCLIVFAGAFYLRVSLSPEEELAVTDRLISEVGAVPPFNWLMSGIASAAGTPLMEVNFDGGSGRGRVLDKRPDGTRFAVNFSLFGDGSADPRGLHIGGAAEGMPDDSGGVAFYDGDGWHHLWCTANEGIAPAGGGRPLAAAEWEYVSGGVEKKTFRHAELRSTHHVSLNGRPLSITKNASMDAGDDYMALEVTVTNMGTSAVVFDYAYGDEPWVGRSGDSMGDVGWFEGGLIEYETTLPAAKYSYAGFWDHGNSEAGEPRVFDGYADFIEWSPRATQVYFSNSFHSVNPDVPLGDAENRVLNIVWKDQFLPQGGSLSYNFAIGMARVDGETGLPRKPKTYLPD